MKRVGVFCLALMLLFTACMPNGGETNASTKTSTSAQTATTTSFVETTTENPSRTESTNGVTKTAATNTRTTVKPADKGAFTV